MNVKYIECKITFRDPVVPYVIHNVPYTKTFAFPTTTLNKGNVPPLLVDMGDCQSDVKPPQQ